MTEKTIFSTRFTDNRMFKVLEAFSEVKNFSKCVTSLLMTRKNMHNFKIKREDIKNAVVEGASFLYLVTRVWNITER